MEIIGHIVTGFRDKFGIPRQSGMCKNVSKIVFEKAYATMDAFKGIESYEYIWVLWEFDVPDSKKLTVRPPRLGGNTHVGVFATRSPFRPNHIGLSSVKLIKIEDDDKLGPVLYVSGADMMDGTAVIDIKPYLKYADCHIDANDGLAKDGLNHSLEVVIPEIYNNLEEIDEIRELLSLDPRPSYQNDIERVYAMKYNFHEIFFRVDGDLLIVSEIKRIR